MSIEEIGKHLGKRIGVEQFHRNVVVYQEDKRAYTIEGVCEQRYVEGSAIESIDWYYGRLTETVLDEAYTEYMCQVKKQYNK